MKKELFFRKTDLSESMAAIGLVLFAILFLYEVMSTDVFASYLKELAAYLFLIISEILEFIELSIFLILIAGLNSIILLLYRRYVVKKLINNV